LPIKQLASILSLAFYKSADYEGGKNISHLKYSLHPIDLFSVYKLSKGQGVRVSQIFSGRYFPMIGAGHPQIL
jgi:hypothetical protein